MSQLHCYSKFFFSTSSSVFLVLYFLFLASIPFQLNVFPLSFSLRASKSVCIHVKPRTPAVAHVLRAQSTWAKMTAESIWDPVERTTSHQEQTVFEIRAQRSEVRASRWVVLIDRGNFEWKNVILEEIPSNSQTTQFHRSIVESYLHGFSKSSKQNCRCTLTFSHVQSSQQSHFVYRFHSILFLDRHSMQLRFPFSNCARATPTPSKHMWNTFGTNILVCTCTCLSR